MSIDKRNISISFGQGVDTKTDPKQVIPGKLLALYNATLDETLTLAKRFGYQPLATFNSPVASSTLTNQKLGVFNNQLIAFDGKTCQSISGGAPIFIDNFLAAQPTVTTIQREPTAIINQDAAYNGAFDNTAYCWSSSCVAPNFQQLAFAGATGKFQISSQNGTTIASTGIFGFVKNRVFSAGNNFYWTGINYASSTLQYFQVPATGSSANFSTPTTIGTGAVGGDFLATTAFNIFNRYQRYDGAVLANNLYVGWFQPATSSLNISLVTVAGVTATRSIKADATGALAVFGDNDNVWAVYHDGASSAGFAVFSTTALDVLSGPNPWFTTQAASSTNAVSLPQQFTGVANGFAANVYTQNINFYPPTQYSRAETLPWQGLQRTDFIWKQSLNGTLGATSGSSAVVIRGMGLSSKAWNYLGDDFFLASYGGTQTSSSADKLEPTNFLIAPTKSSNNIVAKLAFQDGCGYDLQNGGQGFYLNNNFGYVGYGVPLPNPYSTPAKPSAFNVPYLIKTSAAPVSSTSLVEPFFISYNFGLNSVSFDFNAPTLYQSNAYGNNLNVAGGYLSAFDGKTISEQNFHLYPEDIQLIGSSSFGPAANTYAYQSLFEWVDSQGNIFRSSPSRVYTIRTAGSSAIYGLVPTLRATNKKNVKIRIFRNAPTINSLTLYDINPNFPLINNPNVDNVVFVDANNDSAIIGNPPIYTMGDVIENTGVPSPLWLTTYKRRLMVLDPETNTWWYSKEVLPGTCVELSDLSTFSVNTKYGNSNCGIEMGDKFIIFTRSPDGSIGAIYYMVGDGPGADGSNNDFSQPTLVDATVTTDNPNSLIVAPDGVMFQSEKGIWALGTGLQTEYIGAPVEEFTGNRVTSAALIPNTTQVRFTLDNGICLVWDYFQRQWSVFSNINATHGLIYQSLFTYLNQNGNQIQLLQETPDEYLDVSTPVLISLDMSWLSLAGLQGFQRAYRLYVLGESRSPHLLHVSIGYDFNDSPVQTATVRPLSNSNQNWGSDPFWGSLAQWGGEQSLEQFRINLTRQKCQSIRISIQEALDPSNIVYGPGPLLEAIGVVIGGKLSYPKLPASKSVK